MALLDSYNWTLPLVGNEFEVGEQIWKCSSLVSRIDSIKRDVEFSITFVATGQHPRILHAVIPATLLESQLPELNASRLSALLIKPWLAGSFDFHPYWRVTADWSLDKVKWF